MCGVQAAVQCGIVRRSAGSRPGAGGAGAGRSHLLVQVVVGLRRRLRPSQAAASTAGMGSEQRAVLQLADLAGACSCCVVGMSG